MMFFFGQVLMLEVVLGSSTANNTQFICFRITFIIPNCTFSNTA